MSVDILILELLEGPSQKGPSQKGPGQNGPNHSRGSSPNRGLSLPDFQAIGPDGIPKSEWMLARSINRAAQIKIHPDLQVITQFLRDFGLHVVKSTGTERWYRGYGPDQYVYYAREGPMAFLGGAFEVESREDMQKVLEIPNIKILSEGSGDLTNAPGGGQIVTVEDPEGFPVSFVHGQLSQETIYKIPGKLLINDETHKPRQRQFQRFEPGPAEVYKLGHFGLVVEKFEAQLDWYTRYFNIVPSDILYISTNGERREVAMFAHIDRGQDLVDHHTLFLTSITNGMKGHAHHCSFEVHDFDTQALGHQWLSQRKYQSVWGLGRHVLGSQIFDYWWDTTGNMVEHHTDGDLVNLDTPLAFGPAGHEGLAVWGPEVPKAFLE